jgi:sugar lactone lactonase YvrE
MYILKQQLFQTNNLFIYIAIFIYLFGIKAQSQEWVFYDTDDGIASNQVYEIVQDDNGNMWFTSYVGLTMFDRETETMTIYTVEDGLAEDKNYDLWKDINGNIWSSGWDDSAVSMYNGESFNIITFTEGRFEECFYEDVNNNLWIADSYGAGLKVFDGSEWSYYDGSIFNYSGIWSIWGDPNGIIYVATDELEYFYDGVTWETLDSEILNETAKEVFYDSFGRLWLIGDHKCSYHDGEIWRKNRDENYSFYGGRDIDEDSEGNIWIASVISDEITILRPGDFLFTNLRESILEDPLCVEVDWYDNIWIGYAYDGVAHFILNEFANVTEQVDTYTENNNVIVRFPIELFNQFDLGNNVTYSGLTSENTLPDWITFDSQHIKFQLNYSEKERQEDYIVLKVIAKDEDTNKAVVVAKVDLTNILNIDELDYMSSVKVFPNPASDFIKIENNKKKSLSIEIYNIQGKLIKSLISSLDRILIDCNTFNKGVYVVKIYTGLNEIKTTKLLIK